jgi:hypothetical protein
LVVVDLGLVLEFVAVVAAVADLRLDTVADMWLIEAEEALVDSLLHYLCLLGMVGLGLVLVLVVPVDICYRIYLCFLNDF